MSVRKSKNNQSRDNSLSDSETVLPSYLKNRPSQVNFNNNGYQQIPENEGDGNLTDEDFTQHQRSRNIDEFGENFKDSSNKIVRTGRQRKKSAARSKGGEFQARRKKRRLYFCCVSSEIDVQKLYDYCVGAGGLMNGWRYHLYYDVLHLYKAGIEIDESPLQDETNASNRAETPSKEEVDNISMSLEQATIYNPQLSKYETSHHRNQLDAIDNQSGEIFHHLRGKNEKSAFKNTFQQDDLSSKISGIGAQEVFVYDFGAVVFWGFFRGEETNLLKTIRIFVTKGFVEPDEFHRGDDDMAFVISPEEKNITIINDVIIVPDTSTAKQRLAVSFAIAQSTVLSIFEARIEKQVEAYRYIPESLATHGKVRLTERQLGMMIGAVFVVRHDVNLNTEILDTPDYFWNNGEMYESDYHLACRYLEMDGRTEVLNKRLDMLRELLDVLQQQMENAHAVKLEWIVIWLIVIEVVLQTIAVMLPSFQPFRNILN